MVRTLSCLSPGACTLLMVHLALFAAQAMFSAVNVFGKVAMTGLGPVPVMCFRLWGSIPFFLVASFLVEKDSISALLSDKKFAIKSLLLAGLGMGFVNNGSSQLMYLYGLELSTPQNGATLHLTIPVWTTVIALIFKKEKPSILKIAGILVAVAGSVGMLELEALNFENETLIGNILIFIQTITFSFYLVFTKSWSSGLGPFTMSTILFIGAGLLGLVLIPIPPVWQDFVAPVSGDVWFALGMSVIVGTTLPYTLLNWALQNTSPVLVSVYTPMELVATLVLSIALFGDTISWRQGVGMAGILTGLILVTVAKYREEKLKQQEEAQVDDSEIEISEQKEPLLKPTGVTVDIYQEPTPKRPRNDNP